MTATHRVRPSLMPLEDRITPSPAGDLDPTFGEGGKVVLPMQVGLYKASESAEAAGVAVQDDGKLVLVGNRAYSAWFAPTIRAPRVTRLNPDGSPDVTFGNGGSVEFTFGPGNISQSLGDVAMAPGGKIVIVGRDHDYEATGRFDTTPSDFAIARLNPDGSLDTSFGGDGTVTVGFDLGGRYDDAGHAVAVLADGRIVVAGKVETAAGWDFGLIRLNPDGSLDSSFGGTGRVVIAFDYGGINSDVPLEVQVAPDGKVVVSGVTTTPTGNDFAVARLTADGELDPTFGSGGKATVAFDLGGGNNDVAGGLAVLPDGRVVLAGYVTVPSDGPFPSGDTFGVARLTADGNLDPTFDSDGRVTVRFAGGGGEVGNDVVVQPNGRLVVAGYGPGVFAVARLNPDGSRDPSFGTNGEVTVGFETPYGNTWGWANSVALQPDGRVVAVGSAMAPNGGVGFAAIRLLGDAGGGTVVGTVFSDGNGNRVRDHDDPGIAGVTVFADLNGDGAPDPSEPSAATGPDGTYRLTLLADGEYRIRQVVPNGYRPSLYDLDPVLVAGENAVEVNFGNQPIAPEPPPPAVLVLAGGPTDGSAVRLVPAGGPLAVGESVAFFPGFAGAVRTACADVTGDGVTDLVGGAGPGGGPRVAVLDGATGAVVADFFAFEPTFLGGVFVAAADLDGDGKAELVVTPDEGGGPVAAVFAGSGTELSRLLGIPDPAFRGGARPALGDVTGDGTPDLVVSAGFLGGPRVTVWDGRTVLDSGPVRVADFFAFEDSLRNGAFVAAGDVDGDGFAEVAVGAGPGGAPRVRVVSGARLAAWFGSLDQAAWAERFGSLFAGDSSLRGGVRVALKDVDGDGRADLVTGSGAGEPSRVRVYRAGTLLGSAAPAPDQDLDPFAGTLADGVFVG